VGGERKKIKREGGDTHTERERERRDLVVPALLL
jgi:hypothetical protein